MARIVVVGAGAAGIPAAITAALSGARVTLVDKLPQAGGTLWWSGGLTSAAGTRLQHARGVVDSAAGHYADVQRIGRGKADDGVLATLTANAAVSVDWMQDLGVPFSPQPILAGHELYSVARSYSIDSPPEDGPLKGKVLGRVFMAELERVLASSDLFNLVSDARVTRLLTDDAHRIAGVVADTPFGDCRIKADAVILATGGYAASQELLRRFHPRYVKLITQSPAHVTGDGVYLGEEAGAVVVNADICLPAPGSIEDPARPGFRILGGGVPIGRPPALAGDIWVNRLGKRFIAEDDANQAHRERAIAAEPDAVMYVVFDEPMRLGVPDEVASWTRWRLGEPPDPRFVTSSRTLAGLAAAIGVPARNLQDTIAAYNVAVSSGQDELGRTHLNSRIVTPPFHAVATVGTVITTAAGLKVNTNFQALDSRDLPIPGLYVAGELMGSGQIQGDGNSSGMMITSAVTSGRLAARHALTATLPIAPIAPPALQRP